MKVKGAPAERQEPNDAEEKTAGFAVRHRVRGGRWKTVATAATFGEAVRMANCGGDWHLTSNPTAEDETAQTE